MTGRLHILIALICLLADSSSHAQVASKKAQRDSIVVVVNELRTTIAKADSAQQTAIAINARVELAKLVGRTEAITLLEKAAKSAGYLGSMSNEIAIRTLLEAEYRAAGKTKLAYAEADHIRTRITKHGQELLEKARRDSVDLTYRREVLSDSLVAVQLREQQAATTRLAVVQKEQDKWKYIAYALAVLWVLSCIFFLYRLGRTKRSITKRSEKIEVPYAPVALNTEKEFQQPSATLDEPIVTRTDLADDTPREPVDVVLLEMFRKLAPERLATLKDARSRNDSDKIMRVIHSLRPQLMGLDEGRFGPLYTIIRSERVQKDPNEFVASVDEFTHAFEDLITLTSDTD